MSGQFPPYKPRPVIPDNPPDLRHLLSSQRTTTTPLLSLPGTSLSSVQLTLPLELALQLILLGTPVSFLLPLVNFLQYIIFLTIFSRYMVIGVGGKYSDESTLQIQINDNGRIEFFSGIGFPASFHSWCHWYEVVLHGHGRAVQYYSEV